MKRKEYDLIIEQTYTGAKRSDFPLRGKTRRKHRKFSRPNARIL